MNVLHPYCNNDVFLISLSIIIVWWTSIVHNPSYILIKFHVLLTFCYVHWNNIMYLILASWYWLSVEYFFQSANLVLEISLKCPQSYDSTWLEHRYDLIIWWTRVFVAQFYACGFWSRTKLQQYAHCKQEATMEQ